MKNIYNYIKKILVLACVLLFSVNISLNIAKAKHNVSDIRMIETEEIGEPLPRELVADADYYVSYAKNVKYGYSTVGKFIIKTPVSLGRKDLNAFCVQHKVRTPVENSICSSVNVFPSDICTKIMYYGWGGPEQWSGFNNNESYGIVATSLALSYVYNYPTEPLYSDCETFYNWVKLQPEPPEYNLEFSTKKPKVSIDGNKQKTEYITLNGDGRLSVTIPLPNGVVLHDVTNNQAFKNEARIYGGTVFYLSADLDNTDKFSSGELTCNEQAYRCLLFTINDSVQRLIHLEPAPRQVVTGFSLEWQNVYGALKIKKTSAYPELTKNLDGVYSLENTLYCLYENSLEAQLDKNRKYELFTDKNGEAYSDKIIPGTYYLKEVEAPQGYRVDDTINRVTIKAKTTQEMVIQKEFKEIPMYYDGGLIVCKKDAIDDSPVSDAIFEIKYYDTITGKKSDFENVEPERVWYFKSDKNGIVLYDEKYLTEDSDKLYFAGNKAVLPLGTLIITEIEAPKGYLVNGNVFITKITRDKKEPDIVICNPVTVDEVPVAPFEIYKTDDAQDDKKKNPIEHAGFMACRLDELEKDENGVYIWDERKAVDLVFGTSDIMSGESNCKELFTDENGYAKSINLKYGTYVLKETTVPEGYLPVEDIVFTIDKESAVNNPSKLCFELVDKRVVTGQIKLQKYGVIYNEDEEKIIDGNKKKLEGVIFGIYAKNNIVSLTDNETILYEKDELVETMTTDKEGVAVSSSDIPVGKYYIIELECNEEYTLPDEPVLEFEIKDDGSTSIVEYDDGSVKRIDYHSETIINYRTPEISTTACDVKTKSKNVHAEKSVKLIDKVLYKNLTPGERYTVEGVLMVKESQKEFLVDGKKVVGKTEFVPETTDGVVHVEFEFDGEEADGLTIVIFETLYENDEVIFEHNNINDDEQTLYFPDIETVATDSEDEDKELEYNKVVTIKDTISYTNLIPGKEYRIDGILMDRETGKEMLINGNKVVVKKTFCPKKQSGTEEVMFKINTKGLEGKSIVLFEELTLVESEEVVAKHADIESDLQTVYVKKKPDTPTFPDVPKTGDKLLLLICVAAFFLASALGLLIFMIVRKKTR